MSYADRTLTCRDCGRSFTFTAGEQEFFASRGFTNAPSRCPDCREARKAERNAGGYASRGGFDRSRRELYPAVCAQCGRETQVPFQPRGDRPVYCSECYDRQRGARSERSRY